jgi:hypothetical protein
LTVMPGEPFLRAGNPASNSMVFQQCLPGSITLNLQVDLPGQLYFPEAWPSGWRYRIIKGDGQQPGAVGLNHWHAVDRNSRTIPVEAGMSAIQLVYRPLSWRIGNPMCGVAWLAAGIFIARIFWPAQRIIPVLE